MAAEEVPLIGEVREALDSGHPVDLLGLVSMLIVAGDLQRLPPEDEQSPGVEDLVNAFLDVEVPETTALLAALGEMLGDEEGLGARCRQAAAARHDSVPAWLAGSGRTAVHRAARMTHVLGDGDELLLGVRFTDGQELTCVVSIDHLNGSAISDAFVVPDSIDTVLSVAARANTDPDITFEDIAVADARAGLQEALGDPRSILAQSDTWPGCRALVQWVSRLTPRP